MIWQIPWWLFLSLVHAARALSWLLFPRGLYAAAWSKPRCGWHMHDDEYDGTIGGWRTKCRACGREKFVPRAV